MILTDLILWPHQDYALAEVPRRILLGEQSICLTSPTGGGKTRIICGLIDWAIENGWYSIVYTNRKLLIEQLKGVLERHGLTFGVRAAGHDDERHLPVQISSLPTENRRVLKTERWQIHGIGRKVLAIVDEAHINCSEVACKILKMHRESGGVYVGVTATPIDMGHLYDSLVVAGKPSELRRCGALVPAYHYGPDEPDMKDFKQNIKTGEYTENDVRKAIMTKCIFSRVLENYRKLNPDQRPSLLFGPGVKESIWFAEQFSNAGIRAAHIDGEGVWLDGEYDRSTDRQEIIRDFREGRIKVLCNRFVLREGLDIPEVYHLILATIFGGLRTYLQSAGRALRTAPGKDRAIIQDHGGHWHRHGSVNLDREWNLNHTESIINGLRVDQFREKKAIEPVVCPQCGMVRATGVVCPQCGHESTKKSRTVIQTDGKLREHTGDIYRPHYVAMRNNTLHLWTRMYYRAKNSKNRMTFRQAEGFFAYENHYWPPRDLPFMPIDRLDWFRPVAEVPKERLTA